MNSMADLGSTQEGGSAERWVEQAVGGGEETLFTSGTKRRRPATRWRLRAAGVVEEEVRAVREKVSDDR